MTARSADDLAVLFDLEPHPEGGRYRQLHRSAATVAVEGRGVHRAAVTAILFLLARGEASRWHRVLSDEVWHFHEGGPLHLHVFGPAEDYRRLVLGRDPERGESLQAVVPAGAWFGAEPAEGAPFALVGCTCAPGFEYGDFELGTREDLLARFPADRALVEHLTD